MCSKEYQDNHSQALDTFESVVRMLESTDVLLLSIIESLIST